MAVKKKFTGTIGKTLMQTRFEFEEKNPLPENSPNVVYIVLDDTGFAHLGCYGSDINTPNIDALAADGLRYNNFHTTAICSATRASLLTGANHHAAGCASVIELNYGLPNGCGRIVPEYATIAEILHEYGYAAFASGKWHLASALTQAGPYDGWPLQKGFDRYYGFLQAEDNQYYPHLAYDNHILTPKEMALKTDDPEYHFSKDIVDNALENIFTQKNAFPDQPFFLYLAFGAQHAPHHAPKEYIDRYKGVFDEGWDAKRQKWFERQKELGIIPKDAQLTRRSEVVEAWDDLSDDQKKVYARLMESYAGMLEYTDEQIGRLTGYLKEIGEYDNTIIVLLSDNGASAEGGKDGRLNLFESMNIFSSDYTVKEGLKKLDKIGSRETMNHYPTGWANAGNTPFQWYKTWTFEGGVRDPLIISWPKRITDKGSIRSQFHHVSDITPAVLELIGIEKPGHIKGVPQKDFTGTSLAYTIDNPDERSRKHVQYFEIFGNRAIYKDGWKAVVNHSVSESYEADKWELYHVDEDFSEKCDVSGQYPQKLKELQDEFLIEAAKNNVFPMIKKGVQASRGYPGEIMTGRIAVPERFMEFKGVFRPYDLAESNKFNLDTASYGFIADIERESTADEGVIFSTGDKFGGYVLYIKDNTLKFVYNWADIKYYSALYPDLPAGRAEISYDHVYHFGGRVEIILYVNGVQVSYLEIPEANYYKNYTSTIRANNYTPVSPDYEVPFEFTGKLHRVSFHQVEGSVQAKDEILKILHAD